MDTIEKSVVIESDAAQGQRVQSDILVAAKAHEFTVPEIFAIRLAVEEAVVNAIKHGNGSDPMKKVHISYCVNGEQVWVRVVDEGDGFDPDLVPDPTDPANLECPCGRGLWLIRHYMSEVCYSLGGRRVEMWKKKGNTPPPSE